MLPFPQTIEQRDPEVLENNMFEVAEQQPFSIITTISAKFCGPTCFLFKWQALDILEKKAETDGEAGVFFVGWFTLWRYDTPFAEWL